MDATRADQEVTDDMIDAEWQRLSDEKQEVRNDKYSLLKFAAMFVGILMLSGIAFAAIHIASHYNAPEEQDGQGGLSKRRCPPSPPFLSMEAGIYTGESCRDAEQLRVDTDPDRE